MRRREEYRMLGITGKEALLTREGEVELGRRMEAAQIDIIERIIRSPMALRALRPPSVEGAVSLLEMNDEEQGKLTRQEAWAAYIDGMEAARELLNEVLRSSPGRASETSAKGPLCVDPPPASPWRRLSTPEMRRRITGLLRNLARQTATTRRLLEALDERARRIGDARAILREAADAAGMADVDLRRTPPKEPAGTPEPRSADRKSGMDAREIPAIRRRALRAEQSIRAIEAELGTDAETLLDLTKQNELSLARRRRAQSELVQSNLRLVVSVAVKYRDRGLPLSDLIQEGNLGLMKAADRYDHRLGFRFSTFATHWIRQSITRALSNKARLIRIPVNLLDKRRQLERLRRQLRQTSGRDPAPEEVVASSELAPERLDDIQNIIDDPISLETPALRTDGKRVGDYIPDREAPQHDDVVAKHEIRRYTRGLLSILGARERLILRMRFGIDNEECASLREIGDRFGLTRERIRQLEAQALEKLRTTTDISQLKSLLES